MIDRTKPLTEQTASDLRALIDALRGNREIYRLADRRVEERSCDLEIAEATRALAILNRRATETEDQRGAEARMLTADEVLAAVREAYETAPGWKHFKLAPSDIHAIGICVAERLAGRAVDPARLDRIVTIADEAFGIGPVEPLDATLTRIERGIFEQHKRLGEHSAQRGADLREAFLRGGGFVAARVTVTDSGAGPSLDIPTSGEVDDAGADYARSKAGA